MAKERQPLPLRVLVLGRAKECLLFMEKVEAAGHVPLLFAPGEGVDESVQRVRELKPHAIVVEIPLRPKVAALARKIAHEEIAPLFGLGRDDERLPAEGEVTLGGGWGMLRPGIHPRDLSSILEPAVRAFRERVRLSREVARLQRALENRKLVERAKGVLMDRYGLKDAQAYRFMQERAMANRQPLSEIAGSIVALSGLRQACPEAEGGKAGESREAG